MLFRNDVESIEKSCGSSGILAHPGTTQKTEDYTVELEGVIVLKLKILSDMSGGEALASLMGLRVA